VEASCVQDTVQFIQAYYCGINQSFILLILLSAIALALVYAALNALTNHYLTPCVEEFIDRLSKKHYN
jgi:TorA maturation chaperone TorD